jgi:hypothetical protein
VLLKKHVAAELSDVRDADGFTTLSNVIWNVYLSESLPASTSFNGACLKSIAKGLSVDEIWYEPELEPAEIIQLKVASAFTWSSL